MPPSCGVSQASLANNGSEQIVTVHCLGQVPKKVSCRSSDQVHTLKEKVASEFSCEYKCLEGISAAKAGEKLPCLCGARGTAYLLFHFSHCRCSIISVRNYLQNFLLSSFKK